MMRQIIILCSVMFYGLLSAGVLVNVHYCHGQASSASLYVDAHSCVCPGDNHGEDERGCCDDESILIIASDEQVPTWIPQIPNVLVAKVQDVPCVPDTTEKVKIAPTESANPPPLIGIMRYQQFCQPLLYS